MKLKFFICEYDCLDLNIDNKKYTLLEMGLSNLRYIDYIEELENAIEEAIKKAIEWEAGYNAVYINVNKIRVRIASAGAFDDIDANLAMPEEKNIQKEKIYSKKYTKYIDIEINLFKEILLEWKSFVKKTDSMTYSQRKSYRKSIEV